MKKWSSSRQNQYREETDQKNSDSTAIISSVVTTQNVQHQETKDYESVGAQEDEKPLLLTEAKAKEMHDEAIEELQKNFRMQIESIKGTFEKRLDDIENILGKVKDDTTGQQEIIDENKKGSRADEFEDDGKTERERYNTVKLEEDTFSLMMISRWNSWPYLFGLLTFIFQTVLIAIIIRSQLDESFRSTPFNIPVRVKWNVRVGQYLAVLLSIWFQNDLQTSFHMLLLLWTIPENGSAPFREIATSSSSSYRWLSLILPNVIKMIQGSLVLGLSLILIIQYDNLVDIMTNFTALYFISDIDNILFTVASKGYFCSTALRKKTEEVKTVIFSDHATNSDYNRTSMWCRNGLIVAVVTVMLSILSYVAVLQNKGYFFNQLYPNCQVNPEISLKYLDNTLTTEDEEFFGMKHVGDGNCDLLLNTPECKNDGNDCEWFNSNYPDCMVPFPEKIGNGRCDGVFSYFDSVAGELVNGTYNTQKCGWDGGDCIEHNLKYRECSMVTEPFRLGDGTCDGGWYDTSFCKWDGGDCEIAEQRVRRPHCNVADMSLLGNGHCNSLKGQEYNTLECGWDGGDCDQWNRDSTKGAKYEYCEAPDPSRIGDGNCDVGSLYDNIDCDWDGGDCEDLDFNDRFPTCDDMIRVDLPFAGPSTMHEGTCKSLWEMDSVCRTGSIQSFLHFEISMEILGSMTTIGKISLTHCYTAECGWVNKDCSVLGYPNCHPGAFVDLLGNGNCDGQYTGPDWWTEVTSEECGYDLGDCIESQYPNCTIPINDQIRLGDGNCDPWPYDSKECGWDGGDCSNSIFEERYPDCPAELHTGFTGIFEAEVVLIDNKAKIGDGVCDGSYNTIECKYDGGDCIIPEYPHCHVDNPEYIADEICQGLEYNTIDCGFDGGDCEEFNRLYPGCEVEYPYWIGDGSCSGGEYNTIECGFDGGDCEEFNRLYPNCTVTDPLHVGDGSCHLAYNNTECGFDGGDCI